MTELDRPNKAGLRDLLEQAFSGSRWHGFLTSLDGVSEEEALWVPPGYKGFKHQTGSILSIAFHTAGDKLVLTSHAFSDGGFGWPEAAQLFQRLGGSLAAVRQMAHDGHQEVLAQLAAWPEERLSEPRPYYSGKMYPAHRIFGIIAEHDLYHAGQINYVRCLLAGRESSSQDS